MGACSTASAESEWNTPTLGLAPKRRSMVRETQVKSSAIMGMLCTSRSPTGLRP